MTLTAPVFIALLAAITCLYWSVPSRFDTGRAILLVIGSSFVVFLLSPTALLVAVATALTCSVISNTLAKRRSSSLLWTAVGLVVGILALSRIPSFIEPTTTLVDLTGSAFFSLKAIAILSDAYRFSRATRPLDALLLVLFFPTYEAGPIEQPNTLNHTTCKARFDLETFLSGIARILVGLAKQSYLGPVVIGSLVARFSPWSGEFAAHDSGHFGAFLMWVLVKWLQLYIMFSGYSDVAIGSGRLFGIKIRENFNFPFLARNLQDFWKRWHISLIDFMSAYVYQPFVRRTGWRYRGIMVLFLLTGIWHAANVQYFVWGLLHGTAMAGMARWQRSEAGDRYRSWIAKNRLRILTANSVSRIATIFFVAWVSAIGGAETWARALHVLTFGASSSSGF